MDVYFQMSLHKEVVEVEVGKLIKKLVIIWFHASNEYFVQGYSVSHFESITQC